MYISVLIAAFLIGLILFFLRMNRNDRKQLEEELSQPPPHRKHEDPTDIESGNH